ncbi:uracil phosphoribosyltransferase [Sulfurovum sp. zt1-1]|uniref:Uracil phosphoribosyltransferase n=1 Tax=Sulfurovum zhangzhouensis TaxID=3019067 RepID=A0ABT7QY70_9BACT|nr:uracil phosphoribosyltransferase [Sulfurovum zhangzhouensis]MDM5271766.1 uracil phosphoribosyltransferase [Sulfurovum zhangzhouensis]
MITELKHPVLKTLINHLRESQTDALRFRHIVHDIARLMAYEALSTEPSIEREIDTWNGKRTFEFIDEENLLFVSILRAGLPMIESVTALFPNASSGFLAMRRDEKTHQSVIYYDRIPECKGKTVILLDPMVATGGSLCDAISVVKHKEPAKIISLNLIGSPEGLDVVDQKHPDIHLFIAHIDEKLDSNMYIYPGLGDAGDRSYNTKD